MRETVATDTPAALATSFRLVARPPLTSASRLCKPLYKLRGPCRYVNQTSGKKCGPIDNGRPAWSDRHHAVQGSCRICAPGSGKRSLGHRTRQDVDPRDEAGDDETGV